MEKKELTKRLLKGPLCPDCNLKFNPAFKSFLGSDQGKWCSKYKREPSLKTKCTCPYFKVVDKDNPLSVLNTILPIIRRTYPSRIASELVSVQPMDYQKVLKAMKNGANRNDDSERIDEGPAEGA